MPNKRNYINRSIGSYTSSQLGKETDGKQERTKLLNQAIDAIRKLETSDLKELAPELQRKAKLK